MPKFKIGDRVRVRSESSSPFRSRTGNVQQQLPEDTRGVWYMVKFESNDMKTTLRFVERDLELVVGGRSGKK